MDRKICPECGASVVSHSAVCPHCGCTSPEYIAQLAAGEVVYACGECHRPRRMRREENPAVTHNQFARIDKGIVLQLPLTMWNTVFRCLGCDGWNWVTLDERIRGFEMPCPECGVPTRLTTLGRHLTLSKRFLQPLVLGEWRQAGRHLTLKCWHHVYLPTIIEERDLNTAPERQPAPPVLGSVNRGPLPITAAPVPAAASQPPAPADNKKKTQPIPLWPVGQNRDDSAERKTA